MGYCTEFEGEFTFDKPLDDATYKLLLGLNETRRVKRCIKGYGVEGELYIPQTNGQDPTEGEDHVMHANVPPRSQPSLWCGWKPTEDRRHLVWDGSGPFYNYVEWLEYLLRKVIVGAGYSLSGTVTWLGDDDDERDRGSITAHGHYVSVKREDEYAEYTGRGYPKAQSWGDDMVCEVCEAEEEQ